jgi:hypothetical protein
MASSTPDASAIPNEKFLSSLQKYCFKEQMVEYFSENPASGNSGIDLIRHVLPRILLVKRIFKNDRLINSQWDSDIIRPALKRL